MKIIFDSEEEKTKFLNGMASMYCPDDIGVGLANSNDCDADTCEDCWRNCGLDCEVRKEEVEK